MDPEIYIGCCGAYCKTCKPFITRHCRGCKIGYDTGQRDLSKTRCRIKKCSFADKKFKTCADCIDFSRCKILGDFYGKKGYKYKKYRQSLEFIRENGYSEYIRLAGKWTGPYGKFE